MPVSYTHLDVYKRQALLFIRCAISISVQYYVTLASNEKKLISPRIELGTFCVLSRCHNRLDHETDLVVDVRFIHYNTCQPIPACRTRLVSWLPSILFEPSTLEKKDPLVCSSQVPSNFKSTAGYSATSAVFNTSSSGHFLTLTLQSNSSIQSVSTALVCIIMRGPPYAKILLATWH